LRCRKPVVLHQGLQAIDTQWHFPRIDTTSCYAHVLMRGTREAATLASGRDIAVVVTFRLRGAPVIRLGLSFFIARSVSMSDDSHKPRVIDNPDVGEIYANKTIGASFDGGGISVLVGCSRVIPDFIDTSVQRNEPPSVYVTGRLTLSPSAAVELMNALNGILAALSQAPNSPISSSSGGSTKPN
jgi:hypothetical protein